MVLSHANQMYKLAEEERISGTGPALVFIYDELLRKSITTRAECLVRQRIHFLRQSMELFEEAHTFPV